MSAVFEPFGFVPPVLVDPPKPRRRLFVSEEVERVAQAIYGAAQAEAQKQEPDRQLPAYEDDDEDARVFCRSMARAALAAIYFPDADWDALKRLAASGMSAGTAETRSGSGLQPASPPEGDAQNTSREGS